MKGIKTEVITKETQPPCQGRVPVKVNKVELLISPDVNSEFKRSKNDSTTCKNQTIYYYDSMNGILLYIVCFTVLLKCKHVCVPEVKE